MHPSIPKPARRQMLAAALLSTLACAAGPAIGQTDYPRKPIRLIVPFAPAGVADLSARLAADQLSKRLGQTVVVENRAGAAGNIGTQSVAAAEPDGYTLVLGHDGPFTINPHIYARQGFDPLKDFVPIGKIGDVPILIVAHPSVQAKDLNSLVALTKSSASGLSYGSAGAGSTQHLMFELIGQRTGAKLNHVPYKGGAPALADVLGGHIPLAGVALASALDHVKAGRLKALAISSAQRSRLLPDVPTLPESGLQLVITSWDGLLAPARTPRAVVDRINSQLNAVLAEPEVRTQLEVLGMIAAPAGTPEAFGDLIARDLARNADVVKAAKITAD